MSHNGLYWAGLALFLLLGAWLRLAGLERGKSNFPPSDQFEYYLFHPDEETVVRAALASVDPFDPPFTAYGLLPVYVLRTALSMQGLAAADLGVVDERRRVFLTARLIAALLAIAALGMTWALALELAPARADVGRWAGMLALAFVAFAPGAIQQAHFFIVDGFFTAISLVGLWAILRAVSTGERCWYVLAGLLVGALGAVRFNGLALGAVLFAGHLARRRGLRAAEMWMAGAAALALLLVLQPYLWAQPSLLSRVDTSADFALSLQFANLDFLQPWTLVDVHATRYWDHWFGLWPPIAGWPLTLALLAGTAYVVWCGHLSQRLLLLWCGLYFLSVGALPTKAVRYLLPILPALALCLGVACVRLYRYQRAVGASVSMVLVGSVAVYGLAFVRIYTSEDSRVQAGRWVAAEIAPGSRIGLETGAFTLSGVVDPGRYEHLTLSIPGLFYGSTYMLCGQQVDYLAERLSEMEWLLLAEENRAVQFRAVPELFPVVADFYTRLLAGELGFAPVRRFVVEPEFMGIGFTDRGYEPSFLAYDHPVVQVFKRREDAASNEVLAAWRELIGQAVVCPDAALREAVAAVDSLAMALQLSDRYPHSALAHLLVAEAYWRRGDEVAGEAAYQRFLPEGAEGAMRHVQRSPFKHYAPGDAALSLLELELEELALRVLRRGKDEVELAGEKAALEMAESYLRVGQALQQAGQIDKMMEVLVLSLAIHPHKVAYDLLAATAFERGDYALAVNGWRQSLALDEIQPYTHATLGQVLLVKIGAPAEGLVHLRRAIELDPARAEDLAPWLAAAQTELQIGP